MSDALERIKAQVATRQAAVAAAPPPPAPPAAPAPEDTPPPADPAIADLQQAVAELNERLSVLEEAAIEDAMEAVPDMVDPSAMVAAASAAVGDPAPVE